jgi:transcriptional regulator with XRE-family HTH domain
MVLTGIEIRDLRLECGISQKRAASILGVSAATLRRWEKGGPISAGAIPRARLGVHRLKAAVPDARNPRDRRRAPDEWRRALRARREQAGISIQSMARRLNVSPSRLSDYELGTKWPSMYVMEAADRALSNWKG